MGKFILLENHAIQVNILLYCFYLLRNKHVKCSVIVQVLGKCMMFKMLVYKNISLLLCRMYFSYDPITCNEDTEILAKLSEPGKKVNK